MSWLQAAINGVLLGGLYAMFASGLSITFGVMRLVNLAHGDFTAAGAFACWSFVAATGWSPWLSLVVVVPVAFAVGLVLQRVVYDGVVGADPAVQIVATFGLSIAISNWLLQHYGANPKSVNVGSFGTSSLDLGGGLAVGWFPIVRFAVAVALLVALSFFFARTPMGRAFRASSDDPATARLVGIDNTRVYAVALGLAVATAVIAGLFRITETNVSPPDGPALLIFGFEAVIIGGLGSLWGTLAGGMVLGIAQTVGAQVNPSYGILIGNLVFLAILAFRPTGLMPKAVTT